MAGVVSLVTCALTVGAAGGVRSIVTASAPDGSDTLPAASVMVAVSVFEPSAPSGVAVMSTKPAETFEALSTAVPTSVAPDDSLTVSPATGAAGPVPASATRIVGVSSLVMASPGSPELLPAVSDSVGAPGAAASTTSSFDVASDVTLPAASLTVATTL